MVYLAHKVYHHMKTSCAWMPEGSVLFRYAELGQHPTKVGTKATYMLHQWVFADDCYDSSKSTRFLRGILKRDVRDVLVPSFGRTLELAGIQCSTPTHNTIQDSGLSQKREERTDRRLEQDSGSDGLF
jgi:hypothetical protein